MRIVKDSRGQAALLSVLFLVGLLGMCALVLDVGVWFRSSRSAQATADAAALAGAQALPLDPGTATTLAVQYGDKNGGGVSAAGVAITNDLTSNDTITVKVNRSAPAFFSKVFGISAVNTPEQATARADLPSSALGVAPITVNRQHPMLACSPPPCTGPTEIDLADLHTAGSGNAAGAFGLLNLNPGNQNGSVGDGTLAQWLLNGSDQLMPLGTYNSVPSAKFNGSQFDAALLSDYGKTLLFPVYQPPIVISGSNAEFNIIGWVGFTITGAQVQGSGGKIFGSFTRYIAEGIQETSGGSEPDFGVRTIKLTQ